MGGLCSAPSIPKVEVDMNQVQELVKDAIEKIPEAVDKNCREFPEEIKKAEPKDFEVPDTTMKLNKSSSQADIHKAAVLSAVGGHAKDVVKDQIWGQIEPKVSEQIPEGTSNFIKTKALDLARKPVDAAVDKAFEEVLKKLTSGDEKLDAQEVEEIGKEAREEAEEVEREDS